MKYLKLFENYFDEQYDKMMNHIKTIKVGDIVPMETIYRYVEVMQGDNDFDYDRITEYSEYELMQLPSELFDIHPREVSQLMVDEYMAEYTNSNWYPPVIYDMENEELVDGYHRTFTALKAGDKTIFAFVGR